MSSDNQINIKGFKTLCSGDFNSGLKVFSRDGDIIKVNYEGKNYEARIRKADYERKEFVINISGYNFSIKIEEPLDILVNQLGFRSSKQHSLKEIKAPMPGLVVEVHVQIGTIVREGDKLISLEAMKMENIIKASGDGVVEEIWVSKGKTVDKNQLMISFE